MDIEKVSSVSSNFKVADVPKTAPKVQEVEISQQPTNTVSVSAAAVTATQSADEKQEKGQKKEHNPSEATINDAVKSANRKMDKFRCEYSYHEETNRVSIKVLDAETDEVIREIPPEKSLDMLQKMWEMAGILVDERR